MRAPVHVTALMASMGLVVKVSYNHQYYDYVHMNAVLYFPCCTQPMSAFLVYSDWTPLC